MMKKLPVLLLLSALSVEGCALGRGGLGDNVTPEKILEIRIGETTRTEVKALFGEPDLVSNVNDDEDEYTYLQGRSRTVSWKIPPLVTLYGSKTTSSRSHIVLVRFRGETVVKASADVPTGKTE